MAPLTLTLLVALAEMLSDLLSNLAVSCRLWMLRLPPMLPRTLGAVTTAPLRLASPPAFSVTELPALTCVVVKLVSVPSA